MMLLDDIATPSIAKDLRFKLDELDRLRQELGGELGRTTPWMGALRRMVAASSIEGSTSIEGYSVGPAEAMALLSGEAPSGEDESHLAVACYARAMDHVGAMARDPRFRWTDRVILDLHFDACHFQRDKSPGLWRTGPISVTGPNGEIDYRGPDGEDVAKLMAEIVAWLEEDEGDADIVVRAAMAHLNVVSVHPFRDGNGRVARIVQSLVLAREGMVSPEFSSIEEYLGKNTRRLLRGAARCAGRQLPAGSRRIRLGRVLRRGSHLASTAPARSNPRGRQRDGSASNARPRIVAGPTAS